MMDIKVIDISAGYTHTLILLANDKLISFGGTYNLKIPNGLINIKKISAGKDINIVLLSNGTVRTWGINDIPFPLGLNNIIDISAGGGHYMAIKENNDGTRSVICWGRNNENQCDVPLIVKNNNVKKISAGKYHSVALLQTGRVIIWGGTSDIDKIPYTFCENAKDISAGVDHTLILYDDNSLKSFERNNKMRNFPNHNPIKHISAGNNFDVILLNSNKVLQYGYPENLNKNNYLGNRYNNFTKISSGNSHCIGLLDSGKIVIWGNENMLDDLPINHLAPMSNFAIGEDLQSLPDKYFISNIEIKIKKNKILEHDKDLKERLTCGICWTNLVNIRINCGHLFCNECVEQIDACAICRSIIFSRDKIFY
jgi:alpha-tubulin suppressor-like RCC1 family protein